MLTKRIIACLDVRDGRVVKGTRFVDIRDAGDPVELAARYADDGADEVFFLDITASAEGRGIILDVVRAVAGQVFVPLGVGGGLSGVGEMAAVLKAGAEKVSVNTAAVADPSLIEKAAAEFGSQAVVVAIDARSNGNGGWEVVTHGGRRPTGLDAVEWAVRAVGAGAGELLVTSMDRDGMKRGYDLELYRTMYHAVPVPVIASGGAGGVEDIRAVLCEGRADAALAASIFHFGEYTVADVKERLLEMGVHVRPVRDEGGMPARVKA